MTIYRRPRWVVKEAGQEEIEPGIMEGWVHSVAWFAEHSDAEFYMEHNFSSDGTVWSEAWTYDEDLVKKLKKRSNELCEQIVMLTEENNDLQQSLTQAILARDRGIEEIVDD